MMTTRLARSSWLACTLTLVAVAAAAGQAPQLSHALVPGAPVGVTAFVDVAIVPMDTERVLAAHTVLVEGGRIIAMGPKEQVRIPERAVRIDGRDQYLIPGLANMHTHLRFGTSPDSAAELVLFKWLAQGVTTIRNMDHNDSISSQHTLKLRALQAAGHLWSPRIYTAGMWYPHDNFAEMTPDDVTTYVAAYKAAGYDFIKPYYEPLPTFEALVAAAHKVGIPVAGHVPKDVPLERALAGMKSIEHLTGAYWPAPGHDTAAAVQRQLAEAHQRAGVWSCPTQGMFYLDQTGRTKTWPLWAVRGPFIKALHDAGAGLLLGTDALFNNPPTMAQELEAMVAVGLTPYEALVTGTTNVARYFGTEAESGTIAVGKRADLVLLRGNPLVDVRNAAQPAGVMLGGRWLPREMLDQRQATLQQFVDSWQNNSSEVRRTP